MDPTPLRGTQDDTHTLQESIFISSNLCLSSHFLLLLPTPSEIGFIFLTLLCGYKHPDMGGKPPAHKNQCYVQWHTDARGKAGEALQEH